MISTPHTLFKLMILYFLDSVEFALSNAIISDYILGAGYTDYFNIQKSFSELEDESLIVSASTHKTTYYNITDDGRKTLACFHYEISKDIKNEIKDYLKEHFSEIIESLSVVSDYTRIRTNEYFVTCKITERDSVLASLGLTVPDEETARLACRNWAVHNNDIYSYLIKTLLK
ncbi:MAG: DUF4364 family protein [Lachnospiraceae bacterium]|nr:DUF4364 family protein [Lachnospiraceae bacterium]